MPNITSFNRAKKAIREHVFTKYKGDVVGVGIANKAVNGVELDELAVVVYVREKKKDLPDHARVDRDERVKEILVREGVQLDVKQMGHIKKFTLHTNRCRPVVGGVSEGHYRITAGTGSVLVEDEGGLYRLSNNHVYANENNANIHDPILQPGPYDGGALDDRVGELADFVPIRFDRSNKIDAAIRTSDTGVDLQTFLDMPRVPKNTRTALRNELVVKSGRTTGVTSGRVTDLSLDVEVEYDGGLVLFENQLLVESDDVFSQGGDSGSAILGDDNDWVGLLFAGSDDGKFTIANHAIDVCNLLGVVLYTPEVVEEPPVEPPTEPPVEEPEVDINYTKYYILGAVVVVIIVLVNWLL